MPYVNIATFTCFYIIVSLRYNSCYPQSLCGAPWYTCVSCGAPRYCIMVHHCCIIHALWCNIIISHLCYGVQRQYRSCAVVHVVHSVQQSQQLILWRTTVVPQLYCDAPRCSIPIPWCTIVATTYALAYNGSTAVVLWCTTVILQCAVVLP